MSAFQETSASRSFRERLGFHPGVTPLIMLLGLAFLMASVPTLFRVLANLDVGPGYLRSSFSYLWDVSRRWSTVLSDESFGHIGRIALQAGLLVIPVIWLAALVRSAIVKTWRPFGVTVIATTLGAIGIPLVTWLGEVLAVVWRIGGYIANFVLWLLPWVFRVLLWAAVAAVGIAIVAGLGYGLFQLVAYINREHRWLIVTFVVVVAAIIVGAIAAGWLDGILTWLGHALLAVGHWIGGILRWLGAWIARIAGWIAAILRPIVAFVIRIFVIATVFMFIFGIFVAVLGQTGRTVYLPVTSAFRAGRDQGKCIDLAAGVGVAISLMLTAAALDERFGSWFDSAWRSTPLIDHLPTPTAAYDFLLPSAAEGILRPAFAGYLPMVDLGLLVILAVIGTLSLLFGRADWTRDGNARIAVPILLAVGAAISVALILIVLALYLARFADPGN